MASIMNANNKIQARHQRQPITILFNLPQVPRMGTAKMNFGSFDPKLKRDNTHKQGSKKVKALT